MKREVRNSIIKDLVSKGFKRSKNAPFLYLNKSGVAYGLKKGKLLEPDSRNYIFVEKKRLSLPKLILATFASQPIKGGRIVYIDGNKRNLNVDNLRYSSQLLAIQLVSIDKSLLLEAIRCYFNVSKRYSVRNTELTKVYLSFIVEKRGLQGGKNAKLIEYYLLGKNVKECSAKFGLSERDTRAIINDFINGLSNEVIKDKQHGLLNELSYLDRPKTKRQILKDWNDFKKSLYAKK